MPPELTKAIRQPFPTRLYSPKSRCHSPEGGGQYGFEGIPLSQIEVAVEEAVTNVQHTYDAEETASLTSSASCSHSPQGRNPGARHSFDPSASHIQRRT